MSYGRRSNSLFFLNSGFSQEGHNDWNEASFQFSVHQDDPAADRVTKRKLLGVATRRFHIPIPYTDPYTRQAYSFLRIVNAEGAELESLTLYLNYGGDINRLPPVSLANEWAVCQELGSMAARLLSQFPTSLEQDNALLEDPEGGLTVNARNAILQRRSEKHVLQHFVDVASETRRFVAMNQSEFRGCSCNFVFSHFFFSFRLL